MPDTVALNAAAGSLAVLLVVSEVLITATRAPHGTDHQDRGTGLVITAGLAGALGGALATANVGTGPAIAGSSWLLLATGLAVGLAGLGLRLWAVVTLGHLFQQRLVVQEGHTVVQSGPYRLIRHPSYAGPLVLFIGIGLVLDNWVGLALCLVLPFAAYAWRVVVEERMLVRSLGPDYVAYQARTWRLVPGLW